ncbi:hypothetical protein JAAARDRAFT_64138 [Jaapia argillacea MUCL 33604]|uniref:Amidohydrolase-related domain-containing protein n=1 Tax=Jaapia argillacea MUCL 33604 TaxID=933084 RepID=A0A067QDK0_9AGAM|nr:hypothetical protein JAAARDRAFT_64138 [Jaapia argillacea MUCL 33604]
MTLRSDKVDKRQTLSATSPVPLLVPPIPLNAPQILSQCTSLTLPPTPHFLTSPGIFHTNFKDRNTSDRYERGTPPTLIRNAAIWTGARNGTEVVRGDLLMDGGVVRAVGYVPRVLLDEEELVVVDAKGGWVTPGLVDLHSHVGLLSAPFMAGTFDVNSPNGPILPYLRSIDAFNTHDDAFRLAIAGGVTSTQVLPGSGNAIGGQAFIMKMRKTKEGSPTSMIVEPPYSLNGSEVDPKLPPRWRHMKQACGENLRKYGTRMDSIWALRQAYNEARKIKIEQDAYCASVEKGAWSEVRGKEFPEAGKWEMLVDVLRGRVKISNHCYEAVDLDDIVRLTNEFQFPIASFHHASEAWLVPEVLKRTWGGIPSISMFATHHRYKRESYRGSEFAPRVLADNGIPVVMKTDHPVISTRYLLHEAQQAHYYSLPPHLALAAVTSTPAITAGLSHRIGILSEGSDADVVLWDSHPLQLGATPIRVWIDGILQIPGEGEGEIVGKGKEGKEWKEVPEVPSWDVEREEAVKWEGLPPLEGKKESGKVVFVNVKEVWQRGRGGELKEVWATPGDEPASVVVKGGKVVCVGSEAKCLKSSLEEGGPGVEAFETIDLKNGSISPSLMSFGSPLGLEEIMREPSTGDGVLYEPFVKNVPKIFGDTAGIVRAIDALQFSTRNALLAHRSGVTTATSSLSKTTLFGGTYPIISGISTTFRTGAAHALEGGAIVNDMTAMHVTIGRPPPYAPRRGPSVSEEIAGLRRLLLGAEDKNTETGRWFKKAAEGTIPLVIDVASADIMATLLKLKEEVEENRGTDMRMVFARASEAHLLAREIAKADVGVILIPSRPFPETWDDRRILPGPPLSNDTALVTLLEHKVTVALGVRDAWQVQNTRFDLGWAALESNGRIDRREAFALATTNLEELLGVKDMFDDRADLVAYEGGGVFDLSSKVVAVLSPQRGVVDVL